MPWRYFNWGTKRPLLQKNEDDLRKIAVLGEALVDVFPDNEVLGGAPFNVARNLAALGAQPLMITRVGQDPWGERIADEYRRFGMDTQGLQRDAQRPTGTVMVRMQGTHHHFEILEDQSWDRLDALEAAAAVRAAQPDIVYFGTLSQRGPQSRKAIRDAVSATQAVRFLDLNLRDGPDNRTLSAESLALAQRVKVNDDELDSLLEWFVHPGQQPARWGEPAQRQAVDTLMKQFGIERLVVTRGGQGWACFDAEEGELEGTSRPVQLRDTVGAGDAFASVLLLGDMNQWPLPTTLQRASDFATTVCTIRGAVDLDSGIYEAARRDWQIG
jgi:fructokinase